MCLVGCICLLDVFKKEFGGLGSIAQSIQLVPRNTGSRGVEVSFLSLANFHTAGIRKDDVLV